MFNILEATTGSNTGSIVIFAVLIVAIIGLFVWQSISSKKKQKKAEETVNKLKIGDRVKTIGGVCGYVAEINNSENTFVLETGSNDKKSYVKFDKAAIYQTAPANGNDDKPAEPKAQEKPAENVEEKPADEKVEEKPEAKTTVKTTSKKPATKKVANK